MLQIDWNMYFGILFWLALSIAIFLYVLWMWMLDRWEADKYDPPKTRGFLYCHECKDEGQCTIQEGLVMHGAEGACQYGKPKN